MKSYLGSFRLSNSDGRLRWLLITSRRPDATSGLPDRYRYGDTRGPVSHSKVSRPRFGLSVSISGRVLVLLLTLAALINLLTSCSNKSTAQSGVLSKEEMAKALTEFYLKEARINTLHLDQDSARKLMQYYRFKYADSIGMEDSLVEASYQYYLARPVELGEIYDRIIDTLVLKEQRTSINTGPKPVE